MEFTIIEDKNGKEHMVFDLEDLNDEQLIGDKLSDFEILQSLGGGGQGNVFKVCSLINHRIYAMKVVNLEIKENMSEDEKNMIKLIEKNAYNEIEILKKMNHPNIIKYYKYFKEKNKIYIIMEYFDNGDLKNYIEVLIELKKKNMIKKDEIWYIFYQCMSGLTYLHKTNVIHRDIKPDNIFMNKNKIIKIGDFGISTQIKKMKFSVKGTPGYMAPELELENYDEKVDIYSMGCVFYEIYFLKTFFREEWSFKEGKYIKEMVEGSIRLNDEFMKLIFKMLTKNPKERPNSKSIFEIIKVHFNNNFIQNSGLYSTLRCIINLPYLCNYFNNVFQKFDKNKRESKIFTNQLYYYITHQDDWIENMIFLRHKIIEENNFLNNNKEINPYIIFSFILEKVHGELNKISINKSDKRISNNEEIAIKEYRKYFTSNFNSVISDVFVGHMETFRKCQKCDTPSFLFTYYFSIQFDLNSPKLKNYYNKEINLLNLFYEQNKIILNLVNLRKIKCNKCNKEEKHFEKKMFLYFPYHLVLYFDRGNNFENKMTINYPENLDLSSVYKGKDHSPTKYNLIGIIKRCDINGIEHYISLIWNYSKDKKWYLYDNNEVKQLNSQKEHNIGIVVMLFYASPK